MPAIGGADFAPAVEHRIVAPLCVLVVAMGLLFVVMRCERERARERAPAAPAFPLANTAPYMAVDVAARMTTQTAANTALSTASGVASSSASGVASSSASTSASLSASTKKAKATRKPAARRSSEKKQKG